MIKFYRGLRELYNLSEHGSGIYFATDTCEILHNGKSYSGLLSADKSVKTIELVNGIIVVTYTDNTTTEIEVGSGVYKSNITDKTLTTPNSVGGIDNLIDWDSKHPDVTLMKYMDDIRAKEDKVFDEPKLMRTPIVRNGKQVTVLVELKARFDEENNIIWARRLEQAGCHVIYGLVGLKTHAKIVLVVRKEANGIKRYLHLGTGNYNDNTAKLYTDLGLLTANDQFGSDASAFFNLLSGYSEPPVWNKLVMAPLGLREKIYSLIDNEIALAKAGKGGHIIAKMNSLIDQPVIQKLYEASANGVQIELIVRGICGLRTGIEGISDNITVRSIVGRQLEHSRIFWFANGGDEKLYLASADWMPRNLNDRVELFFPVESEVHLKRIKGLLDLYLRDNVGAHMMQSNGTYRRVRNKAEVVSAQSTFYELAQSAATTDKIPMQARLQPMHSRR